MKNLITATVAMFAFAGFAADRKPMAANQVPDNTNPTTPTSPTSPNETRTIPNNDTNTQGMDPLSQWKPSKVTKADTKGIEALYKSMRDAMVSGDVEAAAALCDFPVLMVTDNQAGVPTAEQYTREMWVKEMTPSGPQPRDVKMDRKHKATFLSNALAIVEETNSMMHQGKRQTWKSGAIVINKDGKWLFKSQIEGGWGDVVPPKQAQAPRLTPTPTQPTAAK